MKKIGVLAVQGAVSEHIRLIERAGAEPCEVKYEKQLLQLDGLIIPGGESTAIGRLIRDFGLIEPIKKRAAEGMAVWGTCAGMILMAKEIVNDEVPHLGLMDIAVRRNAYGRQLDSFTAKVRLPEVSDGEIPLVFIRAPYVERVFGEAKVLLTVENNIVACCQDKFLATSFHPELTEDISFHKYFIEKMA